MRKTAKTVVLVLLFLTLCALLAFLVYLHFFSTRDKDISGQWTTEADMTGEAAAEAYIWLRDMEAVSVSMEEVESRMEGLTVQVSLELEQTDRSEGTFRCYVVPGSYEDCSRAAYEAFAALFRELTAKRLRMAGYTGAVDADAVEALVTETFGMSTVSYLMSCGPALMPPLEELQGRYDGDGAYVTDTGILTRQFKAGDAVATKSESYIRKDSELILTKDIGADDSEGYPIVYVLRQTE